VNQFVAKGGYQPSACQLVKPEIHLGRDMRINGDLLEISWDVEWLDLQAGAPKRYRSWFSSVA
jgi:hypothetical protein